MVKAQSSLMTRGKEMLAELAAAAAIATPLAKVATRLGLELLSSENIRERGMAKQGSSA